MSFFGFEQKDLEQDKHNFRNRLVPQSGDINVYTWGEDGYDGLGDLLQEGGDDLNDETFGTVDNVGEGKKFPAARIYLIIYQPFVGKDFDFSNPVLLSDISRLLKNVENGAQEEATEVNAKIPSSKPNPPRTSESLMLSSLPFISASLLSSTIY
jgi:DNA topoisomerase 2-associated protein PAT1